LLDQLRDRITSYLSGNRVCVITTNGSLGAWAIPAQYENIGLELTCFLPRWADAIYHLEQDPRAIVIVMGEQTAPLHWLEVRGVTQIENLSDHRYFAVRIIPERVDLIDQSRGWGARETLDV
jgi:hypothetical protein